jgi:hypothetical protein
VGYTDSDTTGFGVRGPAMSDTKFSVPEGWTKGEPLEVSKMGQIYIVQRSYTPFAGSVANSVMLEYRSQFEMLMFLSWWLQ